jgi:hypothetical protein
MIEVRREKLASLWPSLTAELSGYYQGKKKAPGRPRSPSIENIAIDRMRSE